MQYFALVHVEKGFATGVSFPDLPGCFSAADNDADIFKNAQEALALYARDEVLPSPRTFAEIHTDPEVLADLKEGAYLMAVQLLISARKDRYNVMLSPNLVDEIDRIAAVVGSTRSDFLEMAATLCLRGNAPTQSISGQMLADTLRTEALDYIKLVALTGEAASADSSVERGQIGRRTPEGRMRPMKSSAGADNKPSQGVHQKKKKKRVQAAGKRV
jgi:predicted RNase H-like HicB family nuclease